MFDENEETVTAKRGKIETTADSSLRRRCALPKEEIGNPRRLELLSPLPLTNSVCVDLLPSKARIARPSTRLAGTWFEPSADFGLAKSRCSVVPMVWYPTPS